MGNKEWKKKIVKGKKEKTVDKWGEREREVNLTLPPKANNPRPRVFFSIEKLARRRQ